MASDKYSKLSVKVISGRNLIAKNSGNRSDPYCEVVTLDSKGVKIGKAQLTKVIKANLNPKWDQLVEFLVPDTFSGIKLRVWDKHKFRPDKFMGQCTVKLNPNLMTNGIDDWFPLSRRSNEEVSGDLHVNISYTKDGSGKELQKGKERSMTLTGLQAAPDLRIASTFNSEEVNKKLESTPFTVLPEEVVEEEGESDYERNREGPPTVQLEKLSKETKDLNFSNKNLEILNNSTNYTGQFEYAKSNVRVKSGKWYFEVRILTTGSIQIGWCTTNYEPKKQVGESWSYDGGKQLKYKRGGLAEGYGEYFNNGDIVGCFLDIDAKTIHFARNGKEMGIAYSDVSTGGVRLAAYVALTRRTKVLVNFGKEPFAFPPSNFNMLHCFLTEKEIEQLSQLFLKYKEASNVGALEEFKKKEKQPNVNFEPRDTIYESGVLQFQHDIGCADDEDPLFLVVAWKLNCEKVWEISREEFMNGFTVNACSSIDQIRTKAQEWRTDLKANVQQFRLFYNFVFDYLKEDKKALLAEEAIAAWKIVLKDKPWPLLDSFIEYIKTEHKKAISKDGWQQLWHFMQSHPKHLNDYDSNTSSWPLLFDGYVEWVKEGKSESKKENQDG